MPSGLRWLQEVPKDTPNWIGVWRSVIHMEAEAAEKGNLLNLGRDWLAQTAYADASWGFVWQEIYEHTGLDAQLKELGLAWLGAAPAEHSSWSFVWKPLWDDPAGRDPQLVDITVGWLSRAPADHHSWSFVWRGVWKEGTGAAKAKLRGLGAEWLLKAGTDAPRSNFVKAQLRSTVVSEAKPLSPYAGWWVNGIAALPRRQQLEYVSAGMLWIREHVSQISDWVRIWKTLWELELRPKDDLIELFEAVAPRDEAPAEVEACRALIRNWQNRRRQTKY